MDILIGEEDLKSDNILGIPISIEVVLDIEAYKFLN